MEWTLPEGRHASQRAVLGAAILLNAFAIPVATAQEDAEPGNTPIEEVIVEGYRGVVRSSIETKRDSSTIVDAVSSDDIGDLPALSLGEVLETVTGAASTRDNSGATEISIRGLGPFLGQTTFNGRQATNGSGDRSVNFNQFPSELVNSIKIYKSQQADLVEGGVSGVIDIGSVKPLDYGKQRIQLDAKGSYGPYADRQDNSDTLGWRGTFSYMDQFRTENFGAIGVSVGVQRNATSYPQERIFGSSSWNACDATVTPTQDSAGRWSRCSDTAIDLNGANRDHPFYLVPNSIGLRQQGEKDTRDALFSAVQWQVNDRVEVNFDAQFSSRDYSEDRHDLVFSDVRRVGPYPVFNDNGALRYFEGSSSIDSQGDVLGRTENYGGGGLNVAWTATDRLTLSTDLSYSRTVRDTTERRSRLRSDGLDIYGNPSPLQADFPSYNGSVPYVWDFQGDVPSIFVDPRFDVNDPAMFSDDAQLLRDEERRENTIQALQFDGTYKLDGWIESLKSGIRVAEMDYKDFDLENVFTQTDPTVDRDVNEACRIPFPQSYFLSGARGSTIDSWATFDTLCQFEQYTGTRDIGLPDERRDPNNRDVTERTYAAYVMANYSSSLAGLPLWGNFGVRAVQTNVVSKGLRAELTAEGEPGDIVLVPTGNFSTERFEHDTFDLLPSVNAVLELRKNVLLRGAIYRALARPDPSSLGAGRDFRLNSNDTGDGYSSIEEAVSEVVANGSPGLEPLRAWNYDLSLEWYPNQDSLLSMALYYKNFQGGRIPVVNEETYVIDGQTFTTPVAQTKTTNRSSDLAGVELQATHTFSYLPAPLDGLGVKLSYNYAKSNFKTEDIDLGDRLDPVSGEIIDGIIAPANISGLSKHVASAQLFYGIGPIDLQAIYTYRSDTYQDFVGGNTQLRYVTTGRQLNFRASYRATRNLSLRFEAVNLTNDPRRDDMPVIGSFRDYQIFGPTYYLGFRLKY